MVGLPRTPDREQHERKGRPTISHQPAVVVPDGWRRASDSTSSPTSDAEQHKRKRASSTSGNDCRSMSPGNQHGKITRRRSENNRASDTQHADTITSSPSSGVSPRTTTRGETKAQWKDGSQEAHRTGTLASSSTIKIDANTFIKVGIKADWPSTLPQCQSRQSNPHGRHAHLPPPRLPSPSIGLRYTLSFPPDVPVSLPPRDKVMAVRRRCMPKTTIHVSTTTAPIMSMPASRSTLSPHPLLRRATAPAVWPGATSFRTPLPPLRNDPSVMTPPASPPLMMPLHPSLLQPSPFIVPSSRRPPTPPTVPILAPVPQLSWRVEPLSAPTPLAAPLALAQIPAWLPPPYPVTYSSAAATQQQVRSSSRRRADGPLAVPPPPMPAPPPTQWSSQISVYSAPPAFQHQHRPGGGGGGYNDAAPPHDANATGTSRPSTLRRSVSDSEGCFACSYIYTDSGVFKREQCPSCARVWGWLRGLPEAPSRHFDIA